MKLVKKLFGQDKEEVKLTAVYCALCKKKSGYTGYTPKKEWKIDGKICSKCYGKLLGRNRNMLQQIAPQKEPTIVANSPSRETTLSQADEIAAQDEADICPDCKTANVKGSKFCAICGFKFQIKCPNCENIAAEGSKFCNQCGTSLS